MVLSTCCQSAGNSCQEWLTIALSIFAGMVSIGYFLRPRLYFCIYKGANPISDKKREDNIKVSTTTDEIYLPKYSIKVENMNIWRNTIKEVICDVAVASNKEFRTIKTIELRKDKTLFLKSARQFGGNPLFNYVFWFEEKEITAGYDYLRVRLLASNALGIKKHYERYFKLDEIRDDVNIKTQCQCCHRIKTNKEAFNFIKIGIRCCIGAEIEKLFGCKD
jgi:hypothetical protein